MSGSRMLFRPRLHANWRLTKAAGGHRAAAGQRRWLSLLGGDDSAEAQAWLTQRGVKSDVAEEMIRVLKQAGGSPSCAGLKQLGESGLKALENSVEREQEERNNKKLVQQDKITVLIHNPRVTKELKKVNVYPDETLHNTLCTPIIDDLEFACGGNAACSTCHVILDPEYYAKITPPEEDELDMLDLAWEPTETSRLACQMVLNKNCNNMTITIPQESNNLF